MYILKTIMLMFYGWVDESWLAKVIWERQSNMLEWKHQNVRYKIWQTEWTISGKNDTQDSEGDREDEIVAVNY